MEVDGILQWFKVLNKGLSNCNIDIFLLSGTQTSKEYDNGEEDAVNFTFHHSNLSAATTALDSDSANNREVPVAIATQGSSTADESTSTSLSMETQTRNRDLEPKGIP